MKSGRSIQDVSREILRQQEAKADYGSSMTLFSTWRQQALHRWH